MMTETLTNIRRVHAFASDGRRVAWDEAEDYSVCGPDRGPATLIRLPWDARPGVRLTRSEAPPSLVDQYRAFMLLHGHAWIELQYITPAERASEAAARRYAHRGPAALLPGGAS